MLAGTGSDVGKSILAAAFCRILRQDGYNPAPFKAQNMALNSYATPEGLEIGRAQAVQAEAAGAPCHTDMNPLLLKPSTEYTSQVVLLGKPLDDRNTYEYFCKEGRDELRKVVNDAYDRLAARYNPIVMEGAGSISEINLRDNDLVNMPMAQHAGAAVILVADIDRGGVFASVYGSVLLQTPEDRKRIMYYTNNVNEIAKADIVLLPGSKNTLDDLYELRCNGVVQAILKAHREGATVMGICGGYQMMGLEVRDPDGVEGNFKLLPGLGLLPVITTMQGDKVTRQVNFTFGDKDTVCKGYEIYMGRSVPAEGFSPAPLNKLEDGREDGYRKGRKCMGTYIHGILDNPAFIDYLLEPYAGKLEQNSFDYAAFKEEQYDKLADHVRTHINMPLLYKIL